MISQHRFYQDGMLRITQSIIKCIQTLNLQENATTQSCHLNTCGIPQVNTKNFLLLALQSSSTTVLCCSRSCDLRLQFLILVNHCSCWVVFSSLRMLSRYIFLMGSGCQPHAQHPTWRTRASHLVWVITLTCLAWVALPEVCYCQDSSQYHMTMQAQIQYCHYCPY